MEVLEPLTVFFERTRNDQRISSTHIGIFAALLQYRLQRGFCNPVDTNSLEIMAIAKISALKTYYRCVRELSEMIDAGCEGKELIHPEWLKSRVVRKMLDISPGSLQNLRITGKIRFKKVLGSYYYNRSDLMQLFNDDQSRNATK